MADLKAGLFAFVSNKASIVALIRSRFYPDQADDNAELPYVVYARTSEPSITHLTGVSEIVVAEYQFDIYANDSVEKFDVEEAFRNSFDGFIRGTMGTVFVQSCFITSMRDESEASVDGQEDPVFRTIFDVSITYGRPAPTG